MYMFVWCSLFSLYMLYLWQQVFIHASIVQLHAHVTLLKMCAIPNACVHVYLYTSLMHMSASRHGSLQMIGKSHRYVILWTILKLMGFLQRQVPTSSSWIFLLTREPAPRQKAMMLKHRTITEKVSKTVGLKLWDQRRHQSHDHLRKIQGLSDSD